MEHIKNTNEELIAIYKVANEAYYNDGEPVMSDKDFDGLQDEMNRRGIDTTKLEKGSYGDEVEHFTLCPSLRKVNVKGEFNQGHHADIIKNLSKSPSFRQGQTFQLHYKLDGLAINAMYENGKLKQAATRGDYRVGRNVIGKVRHLLPLTVDPNLTEVRYECVMPVKTFEAKYMGEYSHPRNLASGILNDENVMDERKNDLELIPLNAVFGDKFLNGSSVESMKYPELAPHTFDYDTLVDFDKMKVIFDKMKEDRPTSIFPTDGIVLSPLTALVNDTDGVKYPNHSVSIKFPPNGAKAIVDSVKWNLKKSGEYFPIVNLKPVKIDGRMISKTHGFNYGFILANNINTGAEVEIEIAGDIIPYLSKVVSGSPTEQILPEDSIIDGCHLYTQNADAIKLEQFVYSALKLELKDFGEAFYRSVAAYFEYDVFNIFDRDRFTSMGEMHKMGATKKTAQKFLDRVKSKKEMTLKDIVISCAIDNCGEGTSEEVAKYLAKEHYKLDSKEFDVDYDFARKQKNVVESCTNGYDKKRIISVVAYLKACGVDVILADANKGETGNEIVTFVMTGSPKGSTDYATKGEFKKSLPENFVETKSMSKCNLLITDDLVSNTSKMKEAKKRSVEIRTYSSFSDTEEFNFMG